MSSEIGPGTSGYDPELFKNSRPSEQLFKTLKGHYEDDPDKLKDIEALFKGFSKDAPEPDPNQKGLLL